MAKKLFSIFALSIFILTSALAGKGGPIVSGMWTGTGEAMYMDGTTADITVDYASLTQQGNFVYGNSQFTVKVGENDPQTLPGQISGYIHGNVLKGTFGVCLTVAPDCIGAAVFEGKITGKTLSGTVIDLSDGSTGVVTLKRVSE